MSALAGTIRHDAKTGSVAVRTTFDETLMPNMAWLVATIGMGAHNMSSADVKTWAELYTPPAEAEVESLSGATESEHKQAK